MYDIDELDLSESFSTDTSDLWKDNLDYVELESLDGELWNNRVIVELSSVMHDKVKTKTGIELFVDNSYQIGQHAVRSGKIAKVPKKLVFWDEDDINGLYWKTTMEVKVGDEVWFYGMSAHSGEKIKCNDKLYVIMNYADLYVAKRNGVVVCLNGNVLLKPLFKTEKALSFEKQYIDPDFAEIAYIGSCNTEYEAEYRADDENLKSGMRVCISGIVTRRLEMEPYLNFDGSQYIVCQNYEIQSYFT